VSSLFRLAENAIALSECWMVRTEDDGAHIPFKPSALKDSVPHASLDVKGDSAMFRLTSISFSFGCITQQVILCCVIH
jgi:hypothetical protein